MAITLAKHWPVVTHPRCGSSSWKSVKARYLRSWEEATCGCKAAGRDGVSGWERRAAPARETHCSATWHRQRSGIACIHILQRNMAGRWRTRSPSTTVDQKASSGAAAGRAGALEPVSRCSCKCIAKHGAAQVGGLKAKGLKAAAQTHNNERPSTAAHCNVNSARCLP